MADVQSGLASSRRELLRAQFFYRLDIVLVTWPNSVQSLKLAQNWTQQVTGSALEAFA